MKVTSADVPRNLDIIEANDSFDWLSVSFMAESDC